MKHAYVVFDNDAPLYIARSLAVAERTVALEVEKSTTLAKQELAKAITTEEKAVIERRRDAHFFYHVLVPYVPYTKPESRNAEESGSKH